MIQRIQSVYLALGALAILALMLIDLLWNGPPAQMLAWFLPAVLVAGGAVVLLAIWSIFLYGDRQRQRKIVVFAQVVTIAFMVILYAGLFLSGVLLRAGGEPPLATLLVVLLLPIAAYILFYMARRGIERDIKLVRSVDRLR